MYPTAETLAYLYTTGYPHVYNVMVTQLYTTLGIRSLFKKSLKIPKG